MTAKKFFYIMIAFIVLSLGGIGGAFVWGSKQLKAKYEHIGNLMSDRDLEQDKQLALKKVSEGVKDKDLIDALLKTLLPETKDQESLIVDVIYTATRVAGIRASNIKNFAFSGGSEPDVLSGTEKLKDINGVYAYPFTMQISDVGYNTLLNFLEEIENNDRIVQVSDIQITPNKSVAGELSSVSLSMKAFIKP